MMAQLAASAFSMIRSAVAARSFSASDLPIPIPWACRKVLAMPPPITSASTLLTRFSRRSILVETLAPPMIAITGLVGASSALPSASSSACMVRPAWAGNLWPRPSVEACARCAAENASLTQMSPSFANSATNAGSFFSSSLWKRVFSRQRMSPSFMAATAFAAGSPMQSSAKATGFLITCDKASATGLSESLASRPLGRPKCASKITLPPLPEISVIVGATRSRRVASVTRPCSMGTLRLTRSSTRLPFSSTSSRLRNGFVIDALLSRARRGAKCRCAQPGPTMKPVPDQRRTADALHRVRDTRRSLQQLAHRHGGIGHAVGEAPFVVVPGHHAHEVAVLHLGLVHVERRGVRVVVEVDRDVWCIGVAEDALELLLGRALHRLVDLFLAGLAGSDDLEVDHRDVRCRHADRDAVELAVQFRQHEADCFRRARRRRDHRHRRRAAAIEILVQGVEGRLVAGIGVDRGHEAGFDADGIIEHLGDRREAIGGARTI